MKTIVTNSELLPLVRRLNDAMERLGLGTRYQIAMGNKTLGQNWMLIETAPGKAEIQQHLGKSPRSADWFLEGMLRALQAVAAERDLSRDRDYASRASRVMLGFDPDARAVRRGAEEEESFPFHQRADFLP